MPLLNEPDYDECAHPRVEIIELDPLEDGTPVLRARCTTCGRVEVEPLTVEYAPRPVQVGDRWLPMVTRRANLAVCAGCGRLIFPELSPVPIVLFVRNDNTGEVVGEVDLCQKCGVAALEATGIE